MRKKVTVKNISTLYGHDNSIYGIDGNHSGYIYSAGGDGMVVQWDLSKPKDGYLLAKLESSVYALKYDHEAEYLIVGHNYEGIHMINPTTKEELFKINLPNCKSIFGLEVDEKYIYAATQNGVLYVIEKENRSVKKYKVCGQSLRSVVLKDNRLFIGASDNTVYVLNQDMKLVDKILGAEKSVFGLLPMDEGLITVSRDCHLRFYDHDLKLTNDVVAHMYAINTIVLSPNKECFATGSQDKTIKIWDAKTGQLLKVIDQGRHEGHSNSVNNLFWSRYGNLLVSCSDDRTLKVWELEIE